MLEDKNSYSLSGGGTPTRQTEIKTFPTKKHRLEMASDKKSPLAKQIHSPDLSQQLVNI